MAKQVINLGTMADNKSGDPLRTAFTKINENFTELYDHTGSDGNSIGNESAYVVINENNTVSVVTTGDGSIITDDLKNGQPSILTINEGSSLLHGFDADGLWISGNAGTNGWPVYATNVIPAGKKVVVEFDFVYNENCSDHGVAVWKDGAVPDWSWGPNDSCISAKYNCGAPQLDGRTSSVGGGEGSSILTATNTYRARFTYSPVAGTASLETFDSEGTLLNTLEINSRLEAGDYYVGFSADQDAETDPITKSYFSNLSITAGRIGTAEWIFDKEGNIILPGDGGVIDAHGQPITAIMDLAGAVFDTWSNGQTRLRPIDPDGSILVQSSGNGRSALRWHVRTDPAGGPSMYSQVIVDNQGIRLTNADWSGERQGQVYDWVFNWDGQLVAPEGGKFVGDGSLLTNLPAVPADTGDVTFSGVQVIGGERPEIGHFFTFSGNQNGETPALDNYNAIGLNRDYPGLNLIQVGDLVTLQDNTTTHVTATQDIPDGNFWLIEFAVNLTKASNEVWPLAIQSPDYRPYQNPALILKADQTADYGMEMFNSIDNDTHLKPLKREKGVALGFGYGQGSHVRVEGSNGQGGVPGTGDKVGIVASDGGQLNAEWLFNNDSTMDLPGLGVLRGEQANLVSSGYAQLQWIPSQELSNPDPNGANIRKNWAYVDEEGFTVETNINNPDNSPSRRWEFNNLGETYFPGKMYGDGSTLDLASDVVRTGDRSWIAIVGNGFNSYPSFENNIPGDIFYDCSCALPDGTVMFGGGWSQGWTPILAQYDKEGKMLWQWSGEYNQYDGSVRSIAYDEVNSVLRVSIEASLEGRNNWGTRLVNFVKSNNPERFADIWVVDSSAVLYDANDNGDLRINSSLYLNGQWVGVGEKTGNTFDSTTGAAPATGSGPYKLVINKSDLSQINGKWPNYDTPGWSLYSVNDNGGTLYNTVSETIGQFIDAPFTINGTGTSGRIDIYIDYNTNQYVLNAILWGSGYTVGDTLTVSGSVLNGVDVVNDAVITITEVAEDGMILAGTIAGTPQTDSIIFNFSYYNWSYDYSDTNLVVNVYLQTNSDPFIYSDAGEFTKNHTNPNYGYYNTVVWSDYTEAYYAGGYADRNNGNGGVLDKILPNGTFAWSKTGMGEVYTVATGGDKVFFTGGNSSVIVAVNAQTGATVWQTGDGVANQPWGSGIMSLVYKNDKLYASGYFGSMWGDGIVVSEINPLDGNAVWTRQIHTDNGYMNLNYNGYSELMAVTDDSIFITGYGSLKSNNVNDAFIIRLPLDGGVGYDVMQFAPKDLDNQFRLYSSINGVPFTAQRGVATDFEIIDRTDLNSINPDVTFNGSDFPQNSNWPAVSPNITNLTSNAGIDFRDGTPKATHNPIDIPESQVDWQQNNEYYTLQLSDRGRFIRTQWYNQSSVYINVPTDAEVNFPVGSVITLINMWTWDTYGNSMYINSNNNQFGDRAHVYAVGTGGFPQNDGWSPQWQFKGRGVATLMKVGPNEWLLNGDNITDSDY